MNVLINAISFLDGSESRKADAKKKLLVQQNRGKKEGRGSGGSRGGASGGRITKTA